MDKKYSIILRIISGVAGVAILIFLALIAFSFLGNPVTSLIAGQRMETHISRHFSFLNLEKERVFYNFKTGNYTMRVQDTGSRDTHFSVYYNPRTKATGDTYANDVLGGTNTILRFQEEYALLLHSLLENVLVQQESDYQIASIQVIDEMRWSGTNQDIPPLDAPFEKHFLKDARVMITLSTPDFPGDPVQTAEQMQSLYQAMKKDGDYFTEYILYLEYADRQEQDTPCLAGITGASPEDLENVKFPQRAQELVERSLLEMPEVKYHYADFAEE